MGGAKYSQGPNSVGDEVSVFLVLAFVGIGSLIFPPLFILFFILLVLHIKQLKGD